jgi:glycosyltransferase involved in cell wall biosynthesis
MSVTLIIPAYNEATRLTPFLVTIMQYVRRHPKDIREILVVDDGSHDTTNQIAQRFHAQIPKLKLLRHNTNKGKGAAVQTGIRSARGDLVVFMDADGATSISELPKMISALQENDIAIGNRWMTGAKTQRRSALRRLSGLVNRTYMRFFGLGDIDTMCGFKGYRRAVAVDLFQNLLEERWLFDTEITYKARLRGYTTANFPIRWTSQDGSKLSTYTLLKSALHIWPLIRKIKKAEKRRHLTKRK